ncbi:hypothetical protein L2E82_03117 [Cichorium intybus]|uniref:Uncharacterized protein n=1 Tax=Cichorium intybus TaxID=13427 RepID=A0ACB9H3A8_CICIN|nr:hypothetical protein L2E82_03117 [Cichorium intybus]
MATKTLLLLTLSLSFNQHLFKTSLQERRNKFFCYTCIEKKGYRTEKKAALIRQSLRQGLPMYMWSEKKGQTLSRQQIEAGFVSFPSEKKTAVEEKSSTGDDGHRSKGSRRSHSQPSGLE